MAGVTVDWGINDGPDSLKGLLLYLSYDYTTDVEIKESSFSGMKVVHSRNTKLKDFLSGLTIPGSIIPDDCDDFQVSDRDQRAEKHTLSPTSYNVAPLHRRT